MCGLVVILSHRAIADTLICRDGRELSGEVKQTATGYIIKTKVAEFELRSDEVKEWIKGATPPSTTTPKPAISPGVKPRGTARPEEIKKAVDRLIREGEGALAAGDFKAARDSFMDALQLDKKNALAGHGLGLAYIGLHEPALACDTLEAAANMGAPDRALLINLAVAQSGSGRAMRGAKYILKYLESIPPTQAPDEPLLNTMKIMLESIPPDMRTSEYARMQGVYDRLNKRLEDKAGNGQKRWGLKWIPAEEFTGYEKQRKEAEKEMTARQQDLERARRDLEQAGADLDREKGRRLEGSTVLLRAQTRFDTAQRRYDNALSTYQKLAESVPQPEYPALLATVPMGDAAGSTNDPTKVASAVTPPDPQPKPAPTLFPADPEPKVNPTRPDVKPMTQKPTVQFGGSRQDVVKQVTRHAAGFLIGPDLLVTAAATVKDAQSIEVVGRDGQSTKAEVLRTEGPLALLKVEFKGAARPVLPIAQAAAGGTLKCPAFPSPSSIFDDEAGEVIDNVTISPNGEARMRKHPRLPGSPLMAGGKVVAVELAERESPITAIPVASLEKLRALIAGDAGAAIGAALRDPLDAIYQVQSETR
jgi:tetratricopeptide (TPR) repeat protein